MAEITIGNLLVSMDNVPFHYYHRAEYWPEWFWEQFHPFEAQVRRMAPKSKPLRHSESARLQMGYPHEVTVERKAELSHYQWDSTAQRHGVKIPKLTLSHLDYLWELGQFLAFTTPTDSEFLRDVTIVDTESHSELAFCYVVSRKGHVLAAWAEPLSPKGWSPRLPRGFHKLLCLQTKPLNNGNK